MEIKRSAQAGSVESCDIMITLEPASGITIDLQSDVLIQFGDAIRTVIRETLEKQGVKDCKVIAVDKGALDYTIRARVEAAVARAQ
ncbi:MAG: citrate lyase acyl carrier protein [Bacteroidota bacterium]